MRSIFSYFLLPLVAIAPALGRRGGSEPQEQQSEHETSRLKLRIDEKSDRFLVRSFSRGDTKDSGAGFHLDFDIHDPPSFAFRYFSKMGGSGGSEDSESFSGMRATLWGLCAVNSNNSVVSGSRILFTDNNLKELWSYLQYSTTTSGNASTIKATTSMTYNGWTAQLEAYYTPSNDTAASKIKFAIKVTSFPLPSNTKLGVILAIRSSEADQSHDNDDDSQKVVRVGNAAFKWDGEATIDGAPVTIGIANREFNPSDDNDSTKKGSERSVSRRVFVFNSTAGTANSVFYWDPTITTTSDVSSLVSNSAYEKAVPSVAAILVAFVAAVFAF